MTPTTRGSLAPTAVDHETEILGFPDLQPFARTELEGWTEFRSLSDLKALALPTETSVTVWLSRALTEPAVGSLENVEPEDEDVGLEDESEMANSERLELLARRYADQKFSPEEGARLAVVTARIRRLIPRVTETDLENLAVVAEEVHEVSARVSTITRRRSGD